MNGLFLMAYKYWSGLHLVIRESLQVKKSGQDLMRSILQVKEDHSPLACILYLFSQVAALPVVTQGDLQTGGVALSACLDEMLLITQQAYQSPTC